MENREVCWQRLYGMLLTRLNTFGVNDALGDGDYWLVDDDWGGRHQKISITKADFWSPAVQEAIQDVLKQSFTDWGVYVVFEVTQRPGFIVYADEVAQSPRWE